MVEDVRATVGAGLGWPWINVGAVWAGLGAM